MNTKSCRPNGISLLELIVTLTITLVVTAAALPTFKSILDRSSLEADLRSFATLINHARHAAITLNRTVTVCPGQRTACFARNNWHRGAIVFVDENANRQPDPGENIVGGMAELNSHVRWRAFRNRSYLQFTPTGFTAWQNGHFLFCPTSGSDNLARQLVLNAAGRLYFSRDANADGFHEDVRGRALVC